MGNIKKETKERQENLRRVKEEEQNQLNDDSSSVLYSLVIFLGTPEAGILCNQKFSVFDLAFRNIHKYSKITVGNTFMVSFSSALLSRV